MRQPTISKKTPPINASPEQKTLWPHLQSDFVSLGERFKACDCGSSNINGRVARPRRCLFASKERDTIGQFGYTMLHGKKARQCSRCHHFVQQAALFECWCLASSPYFPCCYARLEFIFLNNSREVLPVKGFILYSYNYLIISFFFNIIQKENYPYSHTLLKLFDSFFSF